MNQYPTGNKCPCAEYSKECLCDYPHKNCDKEIRAIQLWGHRIPMIKYPEKVWGKN